MTSEISPDTVLGERFKVSVRRERGWRGDFFTALDQQRDCEVDIEVMRAGGRQEDQYERLVRREVDIGDWLQSMNHVLRAVAWGRADGGWLWVARDWVPGAKPFEVKTGDMDERVWRVLEAAQAVGALSENGVVHRDLGAQSILTADGKIYLARFGLSKLDEVSEPWAGPAGLPFLHLRCVAPEAFDRPGGVNQRADVYALGVLLFRALSGRWAFPGPSMPQLVGQQLRAQLGKAELPSPAGRGQSIPGRLQDLCRDSIQPDPGLRIATVQEFIDRLEGYLSVSGSGVIALQRGAQADSPLAAKAEPAKAEPAKAEPAKAEPAKAKPVLSEPSEVEISGLDFSSAEEAPLPVLELGDLDLAGSGEMLGGLDLFGGGEEESAVAVEVEPAVAVEPAAVPAMPPPVAKAKSATKSDPQAMEVEFGDSSSFEEDFGSSEDDQLVAVDLDPDDPFAGDDFMAAAGGSSPFGGGGSAAATAASPADPFAGAKPGVPEPGFDDDLAKAGLEDGLTNKFNVILASPGVTPAAPPSLPELSQEELLPPSAFDDFEVERGTLLAAIDPEELGELVENLNQLDAAGLSYLLLDMTHVERLGTGELEALTQVGHLARRRKLQAGMFGVSKGVRHVLQLMDMSEQVPFLLSSDDRKDALMEIASLG